MKLAGAKHRTGITALGVAATLIAALCAMPYLAVLLAAFQGTTETLAHLAETVLGRYTAATLALVTVVGTAAFIVGVSTAWLLS